MQDHDYPDVPRKRVPIWDLPTRIFHWLLVPLLIGMWYTSQDVMTMKWHMWLGYTLLSLLLFRIIWGVMGTRSSRFSNFLAGPVTVYRYLRNLFRGKSPAYVGHNPLGGWSVMLMLGLLLFQGISGLFANDQIFTRGPFARMVSSSTSDTLTRLHQSNFDLLLIVIGIHVLAVALYWLIKRDNLVGPMITGRKWVAPGEASGVRFASLWWALVVLGVSAAGVWGAVTYLP